jgi:hypothetical protein
MQASTIDTPTAGYCGTIFVAIELSQKSWLVTLHSPDRDRISRHKLEGGDHAGPCPSRHFDRDHSSWEPAWNVSSRRMRCIFAATIAWWIVVSATRTWLLILRASTRSRFSCIAPE